MPETIRQLRLLVENQQAEIDRKDQLLKSAAEVIRSQVSQLDEMKQRLERQLQIGKTLKSQRGEVMQIVERRNTQLDKKDQQIERLMRILQSQKKLDEMKQELASAREVADEAPDAVKPVAQLSLRTLLITAAPPQRRMLLGTALYPKVKECLIEQLGANCALTPKVTGMLLDLDNVELLQLLEAKTALAAKVDEAVRVLREFQRIGEENEAAHIAASQ